MLVAEVAIEPEARVTDSVLWAGSRVGSGAQVQGALLGTNVRVGRSARVTGAVLGEGSVISDFSCAT